MKSAERSQFQSGHKLLALQGLRSMNLAPLMANEANSVVTQGNVGAIRVYRMPGFGRSFRSQG